MNQLFKDPQNMTNQTAMTTALDDAAQSVMLQMADEMGAMTPALRAAMDNGVTDPSTVVPAWFSEAAEKRDQGDKLDLRAFFARLAEEHAARLAAMEVHWQGGTTTGAVLAAQLGVDLSTLTLTSWEGLRAAVQGSPITADMLPSLSAPEGGYVQ